MSASGRTSAFRQVVLAKQLSLIRNPDAPQPCEISGLEAEPFDTATAIEDATVAILPALAKNSRIFEVDGKLFRLGRNEDLRDADLTLLSARFGRVATEERDEGAKLVFDALATVYACLAGTRRLPSGSTDEQFEALTHVSGFVGEIVDWIEASAETPNRTLALAAALTFVGTLAGRQYASPSGLRTNVYALGLARSGFGKEHARVCLKNLAAKSGLTRFFGGSDIESGSGMRRRVEQQASIMWMIDEFGKFMRKISNAKTSHSYQITKYLLEYYSTSASTFFGSDYAGEPGAPCHNPNVSVYGTSTPRDFWQSCESLAVADGLLPRILVFNVDGGDEPPEDVRPSMSREEPPERLVDGCRRLVKPKGGGNLSGVLATDGTRPFKALTVPYGPGAEDAYWAYKKEYKHKVHRAEQHGEVLSRVVENGVKIALVLAIGVDPDRPILTVGLIDHGIALAELCASKTLSEISGRLADNDRQREHIDVRRWIVEAGSTGLTRVRLSKKVNGRFDRRRLEDILDTLEKDEKAIVTRLGDGLKEGSRGARYVATCYLR